MSRLADGFSLLLLIVLAACSTRSVHTGVVEPHANLGEGTVKRLVSTWHEQVRQYIDREGKGDPAVLSRTRAAHSRDVLRPGRITFGVLDADSDLPGRNGWDVQGVLIGKQASGVHNWYVFVVGIVRRSNYRPMEIQDIRLVALSAHGGKLRWETSAADPQAGQRYRDTAGSDPVRFPGDNDSFNMTVSGDRVRVQETQSGADWSLRLSNGTSG
jgi:hypothetical protein